MVRLAIRPILLLIVLGLALSAHAEPGGVTHEGVEHAIREGVHHLKEEQKPDGSWEDVDLAAHTGTTSLATLALLKHGRARATPPSISRAVAFLGNSSRIS